mmetsp:Transcript_83059/g.164753  ORF Transcript_83059/g.164753 Transcript_83059/m.164753 type:complete len:258 (-) Transcript_83059:39-812(-)
MIPQWAQKEQLEPITANQTTPTPELFRPAKRQRNPEKPERLVHRRCSHRRGRGLRRLLPIPSEPGDPERPLRQFVHHGNATCQTDSGLQIVGTGRYHPRRHRCCKCAHMLCVPVLRGCSLHRRGHAAWKPTKPDPLVSERICWKSSSREILCDMTPHSSTTCLPPETPAIDSIFESPHCSNMLLASHRCREQADTPPRSVLPNGVSSLQLSIPGTRSGRAVFSLEDPHHVSPNHHICSRQDHLTLVQKCAIATCKRT